MSRRMLLNAFSMNCVSHIQQGLWVRDDTVQLEYTQLDPWVKLAQVLEKGCFDALFLADVVGVYDTYRGGPETSITEGTHPAFRAVRSCQFSLATLGREGCQSSL